MVMNGPGLPAACRLFEDLMRRCGYWIFERHPFDDTLPDHVNPDCWEYIVGRDAEEADDDKAFVLILEADDIGDAFRAATVAVKLLTGDVHASFKGGTLVGGVGQGAIIGGED